MIHKHEQETLYYPRSSAIFSCLHMNLPNFRHECLSRKFIGSVTPLYTLHKLLLFPFQSPLLPRFFIQNSHANTNRVIHHRKWPSYQNRKFKAESVIIRDPFDSAIN